jgi:hypothetical protein
VPSGQRKKGLNMDGQQFDRFAQLVTTAQTRRRALGLFAAAAGSVLGSVGFSGAVAKKHKSKKKTKIKRNGFGCVNVGNACKNDGQCCSGICQGKKGKKKCQAHNEGGCTVERNFCVTGSLLGLCGPDVPSPDICLTTSGNAAFCARLKGFITEVNCQLCRTDTDCENLGFPSGSACVTFTGAACANATDCNGINGSTGTMCLPPAA